jgi:hypothetical protein
MLLAALLACGPKVPETEAPVRPLQLSLLSAVFENDGLDLEISVYNPHSQHIEFRELVLFAAGQSASIQSPQPLAPFQGINMHVVLPIEPTFETVHVSAIGKGEGALGVLEADVESRGSHVH